MPELYRHRLSEILYWLIGPIPGSGNLVIVPKEERSKSAYIIGTDELSQYYDLVPEDVFELHRTYKSKNTFATFRVESLHVNPEDDVTVAFGWYYRSWGGNPAPLVVYDRDRPNWEPVEKKE